MTKKKTIISIIGTIIIVVAAFLVTNKKLNAEEEIVFGPPGKTEGFNVVPTMQDEIMNNSAWVGTFQLVWNDLVNEVVHRDVVFTPQMQMVANLNKQEFTTDMISASYYYKKYGIKTLELKAEIEKGIKEKFNQESDILDLFDWSEAGLNDPNNPNIDRYFFYVMLYRKFEFLQEFNNLENGSFGKYNDIKYFGISDSSKAEVKNQIEVLYYNSPDDFAILINTKTNDEVIYYKNPKGNTFKEIYDNMNSEINSYDGNKIFNEVDRFKAPNLKFNELREYDELTGKTFPIENGEGEILKAVQTIQFYIDAKGGEIKSEAAIDMNYVSSAPTNTPRNFYIDNTFAIFLREKGKDLPYFASKADDITKFQ